MNSYYPIEAALEQLQGNYNWGHSFIRECYLSTFRNFREITNDRGLIEIADTQGPQFCRLIVACAGNESHLGIEFAFHDMSSFAIQRLDELRFDYSFDPRAGHRVSFADSDTQSTLLTYFVAKQVDVCFLEHMYQGVRLRLGYEYPFESPVDASKLEGHWRLCSKCSNAWEENPLTVFSRCPSCEFLTVLCQK